MVRYGLHKSYEFYLYIYICFKTKRLAIRHMRGGVFQPNKEIIP